MPLTSFNLSYIVIGLLLGIACILVVRKLFPNKDHAFWRAGLVIAALIYVCFVFFGNQLSHLPMEVGGVVFFSLFAWLSKKYTLYWLSIGWALHIGWDIFLHSAQTTAYVPLYYPPSCLGFDIAIAGYIAWLVSNRAARI